MQLEYLREFKQLCIGCAINFSRAAEQLHMTQPALSNHVRAPETELGIELIQRGKGRPSCLTPAGVVFLDRIDELLELLQDVRRDCEEAQGRADHALRIRLPLFVDEITESLVRIARAFEQQAEAGTTVVLTEGDDATSAIDCLLEGSIDCCLCSLIDGAPVPFSDQLDYAPFPQGREEVMAWVDTSGPLAAENPVPRDRFENITIPLVSRPTSQMSREWIHGICEQLDHQPTCTSRYGESINSFLLNQLKATDVQFLPAHYRHQPMIALVPTRKLRSLEPPVYTTIHVAFRKNDASNVAQQFRDYLQTL